VTSPRDAGITPGTSGPSAPAGRAARRRIVLWRHGQTDWNVAGRFQGHSDIALNELGLLQARHAARNLAALEPDLLVSSDLLRARQTADELARLTGLAVRHDQALRETNGGRFEGMQGDEIPLAFPQEHAQWISGDADFRVGITGETRREVAGRVVAVLEAVAAELDEGGLAVVATHGGCARLAIASLVGLPLEHVGRLGVMSNCAWSMLSQGSFWSLVEYNARSLPQPVTVEEG
jgi:probable phosphoglycerate mutase